MNVNESYKHDNKSTSKVAARIEVKSTISRLIIAGKNGFCVTSSNQDALSFPLPFLLITNLGPWENSLPVRSAAGFNNKFHPCCLSGGPRARTLGPRLTSHYAITGR